MIARQDLAAGFRALGLRAGDVVMAHASVRAFGEIAGGPDEIHLAIEEVLTPAGTLVMYASCPQYVDEVGRGNLTAAEEAEVLEKLPPFEAATARAARDNGTLVEFFRTWPGTRVNPHPARFAARGAAVDRLFASQPWDFAFGAGSPLERFVELDGRILLLGCDRDTVTFLHYVEHIADIPGKRVARFRVPLREQGVRVWRAMQEYDTSGAGVHPHWPDRFFARLVDGYLASTDNRGARVGNAACHLFSARGLLEFARPMMERVARDRRAADELMKS
jgi:aminoglycoside 3-N-acetyltransferase